MAFHFSLLFSIFSVLIHVDTAGSHVTYGVLICQEEKSTMTYVTLLPNQRMFPPVMGQNVPLSGNTAIGQR